jgi:hypothetical protein
MKDVLSICREVYNSCLHWRKYDFELSGKSPSYYDQQDALPIWKKSHPELCDVHSQVLQNVCKRVDTAFQSYFNRLEDYQIRKEQGRLKIVNDQLEKCPGPPRPKGKGCYEILCAEAKDLESPPLSSRTKKVALSAHSKSFASAQRISVWDYTPIGSD